MSRDLRIAILTIALGVPASWLLAQQPTFPGTLDQLQLALKRLQGEIAYLKDTIKQLSRDAKNTQVVSASPAIVAPPHPATAWQKAREAYKKAVRLEEQRLYRAAVEAYSLALESDPKSDAAF